MLAVTALIAVGCGPGNFKSSEASLKPEPGVLRYPIPNNPSSLDPAVVQDGDTLDLLQQVYEGLVGWDENNQVVGRLAKDWTVSGDGKTYTFNLRPGVKFHDGRALVADDIKWSIERACKPELKSVTVDAYLSDVVGLVDFKNYLAYQKLNPQDQAKMAADLAKTGQKIVPCTDVTGIKVLGLDKISFTLYQPTPYFLGKLTYLVSAPVSRDSAPADAEMNDIKQAVGTGPFKFARFEEKQLAVLDANPDYWEGAPKLKRIERTVALDPTTKLNQYKTGAFDLVQLQRQDIKSLQEDPKYKDQIKFYSRPSIWYVGLDQLSYAPFKDKRVRQAVAMSIDREKIVNELLGGVNTVAYTIVPPGVRGHRDKGNGLEYNPEKAKQLLAEAGYPGGKGLPPLKMTHREGYTDIKLVAEAVAQQLETNLGIHVQVTPVEWRKYLEDYNKKNVHQIFHMRWAADYLDPENFLSHMLATYGPENKIGYNNPEFDALCKKADSLLDWDERIPLYQKAEDIALQDAVWVPIYFQRDAELQRPWVKGMRESLFGHLPHTTTEIDASAK